MGKAAVFAPPPDVQVVYGDGNCFFRALALYSNAALRLAKRSAKGVAEEPEFRTIEDTEAHAMRLDIAQYIVEHPDRDTLFLGLTYEGTEVTTFDAYAAAMRNSGPGNRFAGEYEVLAASGVLHVPIVVHDVVNRVSHKYGASAANTQMRDTGIGRTLHVQYIPDAENPHLSHYNLYVTNLAVAAHDLFPLPPAEWDRCSAEDQLRWQELGWDIKCGWLDQQLPSAYRGKRATDYRRLRYDNRKAYLALRGSATLWTAHCAAVRAIKRPYTDQKAVHNQKTCQDCGRSAAAQTSLKRWRRLCLCQGLERLLCSTCIVKQTSPLTGEKCTANEKKARDSVAGGAAPCLGAQHEARLNMVGEPWTTEAEALKAAGKPTRDPHGPSTGVSEYDDADDVVDGSQWDDTPQVAGERPAGSAQPHSAPAPPWSDLVRIMKTPECQSDLRTMADDHKDPKDHLQCTWSEWATLVPGSMVNDAPLFLWLKHRFNADVLASNALLVTNQLYSLLRDSPNNDAHTWFKSKPTTTASLIFVPIHAYFHYFLAVIDATKKEIVFWDSLAEEPEHDPVSGLRKNKKTTEFDLLLKWLKEEHEQKGVAFDLSEWKALEKQQDGPQQHDGSNDCGICMATTALWVARAEGAAYPHPDGMAAVREEIAAYAWSLSPHIPKLAVPAATASAGADASVQAQAEPDPHVPKRPRLEPRALCPARATRPLQTTGFSKHVDDGGGGGGDGPEIGADVGTEEGFRFHRTRLSNGGKKGRDMIKDSVRLLTCGLYEQDVAAHRHEAIARLFATFYERNLAADAHWPVDSTRARILSEMGLVATAEAVAVLRQWIAEAVTDPHLAVSVVADAASVRESKFQAIGFVRPGYTEGKRTHWERLILGCAKVKVSTNENLRDVMLEILTDACAIHNYVFCGAPYRTHHQRRATQRKGFKRGKRGAVFVEHEDKEREEYTECFSGGEESNEACAFTHAPVQPEHLVCGIESSCTDHGETCMFGKEGSLMEWIKTQTENVVREEFAAWTAEQVVRKKQLRDDWLAASPEEYNATAESTREKMLSNLVDKDGRMLASWEGRLERAERRTFTAYFCDVRRAPPPPPPPPPPPFPRPPPLPPAPARPLRFAA